MEQKFKVNQMLTNRQTGHVEKIYATTPDGQPFDLLEISILTHYEVITIEALEEKLQQAGITYELVPVGRTHLLTVATKEDAERFIEQIAPLYNEVLQS